MKFKIEKNTIFLAVITLLLIILLAIFFLQKKSSLTSPLESPLSSPEEAPVQAVVLSTEEDLNKVALPVVKPETQTSKLVKVLNANPVAANLEDREGNKMPGLRVLGEIQNIGKEVVENAIMLVRFYGEDDTVLDTKTAFWHQDYEFLSLVPGEISLYDILIPEPPVSESITISIKSDQTNKPNKPVRLQIKEEKLEGAVLEKDEQQIPYFKFTGTLLNNNDFAVTNHGFYVWLKDDQNKVISAAYQTFNAEKLAKDQEVNITLALLPINPESKTAYQAKAKTFGEKL